MKLLPPFVLSSVALLAAPHAAQAQAAGSRGNTAAELASASTASKQSSAHVSIAWAKERLEEMDATLASLESDLSRLSAENRARAERARDEMRRQRDAFKQEVDANMLAGEAAWQRTRATLDSRWFAFEANVQTWADATGQRLAEHQVMFAARADALTKSWHAMVDELEASANNFDAARKRDADAALKSMQTELDAADARMKALKQAGSESWAALNRALAESRAAFDRANQTGRQQANASAGENSK